MGHFVQPFQPQRFFDHLIILVKMVFVAGQMISKWSRVQRGTYHKTVPIRPLDLSVEVVHPLGIAGIPVTEQFP